MKEADIIKQGFIYCPYCGNKVYPEISTFTDDTVDGMYQCNDCLSEFTVSNDAWGPDDDH